LANTVLVYTPLVARDELTVSNTAKVILLLLPSNVQFLGTLLEAVCALIAYLLMFLAVGNSYVIMCGVTPVEVCHNKPTV